MTSGRPSAVSYVKLVVVELTVLLVRNPTVVGVACVTRQTIRLVVAELCVCDVRLP
jgi:hypothetical protein